MKSSEQLYLSYDTTFNLGDFYVSVIVFKHILFKETPLIPLAFVIHDRKFSSVHEIFFNFLKNSVPKITKKKIPIMVDREPGIKKAIENALPGCPILTCWNHLLSDFKFWLKKNSATQDNINLYVYHVRKMLTCDTEDEFLQVAEDLTSKRSLDILHRAGKWVLEQFEGLYDPFLVS